MAPWHSLVARALGLLALAPIAPAFGAAPRPVRVTVQAQAHFDGPRSARLPGGDVELRAELRDDAGAPIAGAEVAVASPRGQLLLSTCAPRAVRLRRGATLRSDTDGGVCARVAGAPPSAEVELSFSGDALHLPTSARIAVQPPPAELGLLFATPSLELELDQPTLRLSLSVAGAPAPEPIPALELELREGDRSRPLVASAWSRSGAELSFSLATAQLGAPGPARLVVRDAGGTRRVRAEAVALKVATVRLGAELAGPAEPGSALELRVWAEPRGELAPSGWVEAARGDGESSLGSAPFEAGSALLRLGEQDATGEVWLHYRSADPWWRAGAPLQLALGAPAPPREPRRWPWLALLVPIGYVCLRSLQRPAPRKLERRAPAAVAAAAAPLAIEAAAPPSGWVGQVRDAHDGLPIAGARVQLSLPSFRAGEATTLSATTDVQGEFRLPPLPEPLPEGARLKVWAALHSDVDRQLPPQGRVSITLTSRRRAVLRRLVRWARSLGAPWRGAEPTPAEVATLARRRGEGHAARWAEAVQAAAFGAAPVDEALEAELRAAEPAGRHGSPAERDAHDD